MSYNGRLGLYGLLFSWEENAGFNGANAAYKVGSWAFATSIGLLASLVLDEDHPTNQPNGQAPAPQCDQNNQPRLVRWASKGINTFSRVVHGVKDTLLSPYYLLTGKTTFKESARTAANWVGPQVVMKELVQPGFSKLTGGSFKKFVINFMRPFFERLMPKFYGLFDRGDIEFSLRSLIRNEYKNPNWFAWTWDWATSIPAYIATAPLRLYSLWQWAFNPKHYQEAIGKNAYNLGHQTIEFVEKTMPSAFSSTYNTCYEFMSSPITAYKCIANGESVTTCAEYAQNWVARKASGLWSYVQPVASAGKHLAGWSWNKFADFADTSAEVASQTIGGTKTQWLWGGAAVSTVVGGLFAWRFGVNAWQRFWARPFRPGVVVNNHNQNNQNCGDQGPPKQPGNQPRVNRDGIVQQLAEGVPQQQHQLARGGHGGNPQASATGGPVLNLFSFGGNMPQMMGQGPHAAQGAPGIRIEEVDEQQRQQPQQPLRLGNDG